VGGQLDLVKILILLSEKKIITNIKIGTNYTMKVAGNCLIFPGKKN
jgi:hypothetical protein